MIVNDASLLTNIIICIGIWAFVGCIYVLGKLFGTIVQNITDKRKLKKTFEDNEKKEKDGK